MTAEPRTVDGTQTLLPRVARGDQSAVRAVIERYSDLVWSLARRSASSDQEAEEAVMEVFAQLWRKADRFDPARGAEVTFVSVLTRRVLIQRWRAAERRPRMGELPDESPLPPAAAGVERSEEEAAALAALADLPEEQQRVLRLSIVNGHSHQWISEVTALPLGTVKTMVRRGLIRIRDVLNAASQRVEARP